MPRARYQSIGGRPGRVRGAGAVPEPTDALPGSPEKQRVLEERARKGLDLDAPNDATNTDSRHTVWAFAGSYLRPTGESEEEKIKEPYDHDSLGGRVREARLKAQLSRKQLALRAAVTEACLSYLERNVWEPRLQVLVSIADVLHVSLDSLVGRAFTS